METLHLMPYITSGSRRIGRLLGALAGAGVLALSVPAANAAGPAANPPGCVPEAKLALQPFAPWDDHADYVLVPGGDFEDARTGWALRRGARVVDGNQDASPGSAGDHRSLSLSKKGSAVSPPVCIDDTYPSFRLFARNSGDRESKLTIDVLYTDLSGRKVSRRVGEHVATSRSWAPTAPLYIGLTFASGAAPVAFRFSSDDEDGDWLIDDVYVDPMAR